MSQLSLLSMQFFGFALDHSSQDSQNPVDFVTGSPPVVGRECPEGEIFNPDLGRGGSDPANVIRSMLMAG